MALYIIIAKMQKWLLLISVLVVCLSTKAQTYHVQGYVYAQADSTVVPGALVKITSLSDTTKTIGTATDDNGYFEIGHLSNGMYRAAISGMSLAPFSKVFKVENADKNLGKVYLSSDDKLLKAVEIVENQVRVEIKDDTTEYNAKAFKTNPDATAEDLVKKMPGITSENGTIKSNGEEIKKVTVDGKNFFGDDASMALKNLPADAVDKVQVFDGLSDQGAFSSFDDGNSQKQMNIVTRAGMNKSVFGKVYAGYGYLNSSRYNGGATINWFDGNRRISLLAMSNNINEQNFSMQDIVGMTGGSGGGRGGGGMGRPMGGGGRNNMMSNSPAGSFMVGNSDGISTSHAIGTNYTDVVGKKKNVRLTGSYFFNASTNVTQKEVTRQYFNRGDSSITYNETTSSNTKNFNHRLNLKIEYAIDTSNSLIISPRFSWQQNLPGSTVNGINTIGKSEFLSSSLTGSSSKNTGYNASTDVLFQHKFKSAWRTFSANLSFTASNRFNNSSLLSQNQFSAIADTVELNQNGQTASQNYTTSATINYTEPIGENGIMLFTYNPSYSKSLSNKKTYNYNQNTGEYDVTDTALTNQFNNEYMTQKAGFNYKYREGKVVVTFGANGQYALLTGEQLIPNTFRITKSFLNVLPIASFNYKFSTTSSFRLNYRTFTTAPSVQQLQNVVDNSNPLLLSTGNPDLQQSFTHSVFARYNITNVKKAQSFFLFSSFNIMQNNISNTTIIATKDTSINGTLLPSGSQLSIPVNINGNMTANAFATYSFPVKKMKSNWSFNVGVSYNRNPSFINGTKNISNTIAPNVGTNLSSNISDKIDFTISYNASYNVVRNSLQRQSNNNFFNHNANVRFNWMFWKGFVFNTTFTNTLYSGISQGFNQNVILWNAALGYKFLKDKSLDIRVSVNDILNQNRAVNRSVTETYIEDTKSVILQRYFMVTLTYNLKQMLSQKTKSAP